MYLYLNNFFCRTNSILFAITFTEISIKFKIGRIKKKKNI